MNTVRILQAQIHAVTCDELLNRLDRGVLFTPNVDQLVKLESDEEFGPTGFYATAEFSISAQNS